MRITKITQAKLDNPKCYLKDRTSIALTDINGLMIRIFLRKKKISVKFVHRCTWNNKRIEVRIKATKLSAARIIAEKRINAVRNNKHPDSYLTEVLNLTMNDAIEAYRAKKKSSWSQRTLEEYNSIVSLHIEKQIGKTPLSEINVSYVKLNILDKLYNEAKFNTLRKVISYLKLIMQHVCNLYHDQGYDDLHRLNSVFDIPQGVHFKSMVGKGTIEDIQLNIKKIFAALKEVKTRSIMPKIALEINFYLLLRVSELLDITIRDLDFDKHILHVRKTKTISEKEGGFDVPLAPHVEELFRFAISKRETNETGYVFANKSTDSGQVSERTLIDLFYQAKLPMTIHGIRAMGRTWLGLNNVKFELAEACLSHKVGSQTVQAYLRTDFIEERRGIMSNWCEFLKTNIGQNSIAYSIPEPDQKKEKNKKKSSQSKDHAAN